MNNLIKFVLLLVLICSNSLFSNDKITITNGEWPPYFSKNLPDYGITSALVTKAFRLENIDVEYKWYPWKRGFYFAKSGKYNATLGWAKTKEREEFFLFSEPILEGKVVFFHLKSTPFDWEKLTDIKNIKIGNVSTYEYANKLTLLEKNQNVKIFNVDNEKKLFELLINKRFHIAIINLDVGIGILKKYFSKEELDKVTYHKKPLHIEYLRVLFNKIEKRNEDYLKALNRGLKTIKESKDK